MLKNVSVLIAQSKARMKIQYSVYNEYRDMEGHSSHLLLVVGFNEMISYKQHFFHKFVGDCETCVAFCFAC